jgi:6-pyruvoyl-tetrahydropterin synthase
MAQVVSKKENYECVALDHAFLNHQKDGTSWSDMDICLFSKNQASPTLSKNFWSLSAHRVHSRESLE